MPRRDFRDDALGDRADQVRRHLHVVHLGEKAVNLADRHPTGIQRQDLVIEAREPPLRLAISRGSNVPSRSRGTSSGNGRSAVSTVLLPLPLR